MMVDTHTHILPGIDDGAQSLGESLRMLRKCRDQGVKKVVLTPHFYPTVESVDSFLARRAQAYETLCSAVTEDLPQLILGAEVAWCPSLEHMEQLTDLTMGNSRYMLLELPYMAWDNSHLDGVRELILDGRVVPVIAHVERALHLQRRGQYQALAQLQVPMQISSEIFGKPFGGKKALRLMSQGSWMIGSDCHNTTNRPPCMDRAARYLQAHGQELRQCLDWTF